MKVSEIFIVSVDSTWQTLYKCSINENESVWFITSKGAFGQRDMYHEQITDIRAKSLISIMSESTPVFI